MKPDITIEMDFTVKDESVIIRTNAKHEKVQELLEDYLHSIVGAGKDSAPPETRDIYKIAIGVELAAGDVWGSSHDCGNKGLRDGIIMRILALVAEKSSKISFVD
jgi:hypothetical protein